jgi:HK97 family phage major capsid protein
MTQQELETLMKKMLADTAKGLATREELTTAVADATKKYFEEEKGEQEKALKAAQQALKETQDQVSSLEKQIKRLLSTNFADIKAPDGTYKGFWPTLKSAEDFGFFVMAEILGNKSAGTELENRGYDRRRMVGDKIVNFKDISTSQNVTGGAVVPTQFMGILPSLMGLYGKYRANAGFWPMSGDSGVGAVQTSDPLVYSPGMGTQPTASNMGWKTVGLNIRKLMTLVPIDSEAVEDMAIAIGEVVGRGIARAMGKQEDVCGFLGDGTSTYFGFLGLIPALLGVNATPANINGLRIQATAGTWGAITVDDLTALPGLIEDEADDGVDCKFYCHRNFYHTVILALLLKLGGTNATEAIQTGYTANPRCLGRPVEFVRCMARVKAAADHVPLLLANLRIGALLGQTRALTIEESREAGFPTDQTLVRGTERIGMNNQVGLGNDTTAAEADRTGGAVVGLLADIA